MKLPKVYKASDYEEKIYKIWEDSGSFTPRSKGEAYSLVLPPPNATGKLHVGHASMVAIEDTIVRYQRMLGKSVLWVPGTDHAAIATNAVVEKRLAAKGTDRHELGREKFLEEVHSYVAKSQDDIRRQIRALGASLDWSRERYTMETAMNRIVGEVFIKMHDDGLVYRGRRIVNWDRILQTTVSDDEVDYHEEVTTFYTFKYGPFEIGTARPETKFGDKYVVMHPDDKRYSQYTHGQEFEADWISGKIRAKVIKDKAVDPEFGTGVMTITPWHDAKDFEIAQRHKLDMQQIIDLDGRLLDVAGDMAGLDIAEARNAVVEKLRSKNLVIKEDKTYRHNVAISDRGKAVIEPQIMEQWFVDVNKPVVKWKGKTQSIKQIMQQVVHDQDIEILPKRFNKTYFHWIDNLRDWCISRQIWWGHRIPAWYRLKEGGGHEIKVGFEEPEGEGWNQDPDTLDTWFSSALWSWSTLISAEVANDPKNSLDEMLKKSPDYKKFHPTNLLETGYDILFFWVARMILSTTYVTGEIPFKTVYLHGLVRTKTGAKMSKSTPEGSIDPLDMIEKFGTDALRLALVFGQTPGSDVRIYEEKIEAQRNFCNKLWNIARYVESKFGDEKIEPKPKAEHTADHWILSRLAVTTKGVSANLDKHQLGKAFEILQNFIWGDFADWYIEVSKIQYNPELLAYVLDTTLRLVHPFAPYVSETIWGTLGWRESLLIEEDWPVVKAGDQKKTAEFDEIVNIVKEVRHIRTQLKMDDNYLYHKTSDFLEENKDLIVKLTGLRGVRKVSSGKGLHLNSTVMECWIDVSAHKAHSYMLKLITKREESKQLVSKLEERLANKKYTKQAPKELVEQTAQQLADQKILLEKLEKEVGSFEGAIRRT